MVEVSPQDLAALHAAAFEDSRAWSAAEIAGLLDSPLVFFVTQEGGFALGRAVAGEAELLTIAVHPDFRRAGLGATLLAAFEDESRARNAERAILEVAQDNTAALALYSREGYQIFAERPSYYTRRDGSQITASLMEKALN